MSKDKLVDRIGQFTTVPNSVYRLIPEIGKDAFMVFVCLRNHSDEHDVSFPSYDLICQETTLTRSRVSKAIKVLEDAELLKRKQRFSASTIYILQMPPISPPVELMDEKKEEQPPLVHPPDYISPPVELPLVQGGDTNQNQLTRSTELDKDGGNGVFAEIVQLYQSSVGELNLQTADTIKEWIDNYPVLWVKEAIAEAKKNKARHPNYVSTILLRWEKEGKDNGRKKRGQFPSAEIAGTGWESTEDDDYVELTDEEIEAIKKEMDVPRRGRDVLEWE